MINRPRRLRSTASIRALVRETNVLTSDLIFPLFIVEGENIKREVTSMPGIYQLSIDRYIEELKEIESLGIKGIMLFGVPNHKDAVGSAAYDDDGIIQKAIRAGKKVAPELIFIADVCLCEYTDHGHCGIVSGNEIINDETLPLLARVAVSLAEAGADIIAPSDMMDGRIGYIRKALDEKGFKLLPIMAYSVKYASAYYGPFRDAANSAPSFGDRKTYQMDYANTKEALREVELDIEQGADIIIVKPAILYLDVIKSVSQEFNIPLAAYNISGEYSMIKAAAKNGFINEKQAVIESLVAIKRAGANLIITYFAKEYAGWLKESGCDL